MQTILRLISLLAIALQVGCASNRLLNTKLSKLDELSIPKSKTIQNVPFILQKENFCGPATLAMYMQWLGINQTPEQLADISFSKSAKGTYKSNLVSAARINGLMTAPVNSYKNLVLEIQAGNPVIVFQNLGFDWYPLWHYSLIYGYNINKKTIVIHSGEEKSKEVPLKLFDNSWKRANYWAITLTPSTKLSKTAKQFDYIKSAAALESLNLSKKATQAYSEIIKRWPKSHMAYFGLGNIHYKNNNVQAAVKAYKKSVELNTNFSIAWFNLALLSEETKNMKEAKTAAREAISHANEKQLKLFKEKLSHLI